jgi:hypothetical protein
MPYMVRRRYRGTHADIVELDKIVARELVPELKAIPGFIRYVAAVYDDSTIGSFSGFETEEGLNRSNEIGKKWAESSGAMRDMKLVDTVSGRMLVTLELKDSNIPGYTMHRIYKTDQSEQEAERVFKTIMPEYGSHATGLVRGTVLYLNDKRIMTVGWFDTPEHAAASTAVAKSLTTPGSDIAKLLAYGAEHILTGKMISVH